MKLISNSKKILSGQFVRNVGWLGSAELLNRVVRLGTTVVLARFLSPHDYGLAAIVLTIQEFATVFTLRAGVGSKIIQSKEQDLSVLCNTAYWLNWMAGIVLFITQCMAAFPIAWIYGDNNLILPLCITAIVYLLMPIYSIHNALIERNNRHKVIALGNAVQLSMSNILAIILAFLGWGMWAIVLPGVLTVPIWIFIAYKKESWRPSMSFSLDRWKDIISYGKDILGCQLLEKLRSNLDYLLVGNFLGIDALGLYFFAFNAGLGISMNVINVLTWPLLPHLCAVRDDFQKLKTNYFKSLKTISTIIIPLVLLQSSLAPFYVPIIFGQKWIAAIPILILVCLSALPRPFAGAASVLLLAVDKSKITLQWNIIFTVFFTIALIGAMRWGTLAVAAAVLITHVVAMPLFAIWATKYVLDKPSSPVQQIKA